MRGVSSASDVLHEKDGSVQLQAFGRSLTSWPQMNTAASDGSRKLWKIIGRGE